MASPKADVYQAAERIRDALTRLGYCYRTRRGDLIEVSYRALGVVQDRYGILEVDVQRLPPRVSIDRLTADSTLHHLTAVVGRPVRKLNTTGLTYCIELVPTVARRLPRRAHLDLATRPLGEFMVPIGQGMDRAEWRSLLDTSHILVGGESRSGKSTWLNAALLALLTACPPTVLRLGVIDPKGVEFTAYGGLPHLVRPIATTPQAASSLSGWLMAEMDRRRDLFASVLARGLQGYNRRACAAGSAPLPLMLVIIDEVSDIAMQCGLKSEFYKNLIRLSSKGAAFGLVLVLATQNPKAEVLNTLIRGNMSTRIAFRVASIEHSRTILGCGGAQELPRTVRGRLLARLDESLTELQGYYVPDEEVLALVRHWATQDGPRLTPLEQELVRYARHELGGSFPIGRLYQRFRGTISHRQLVKLARRWASMGWLSPQSSVVAARQLTDRVIEIAQRSTDQPGPPDTGCQDMGQGDQGQE